MLSRNVLSRHSRNTGRRLLSLVETAKSISRNNDKAEKIASLVKIVATIGPSSEQYPVLSKVVQAGMRIMRINFSHATYEEADLRTQNLLKCPGLAQSAERSNFNLRAIMLDTQGPEIRTGSWVGGAKNLELESGDAIVLSTDEAARMAQTKDRIWISYKDIGTTVKKGSEILLDDGAIGLNVEDIKGSEVMCRIMNSGTLGNKKGVNIPGAKLTLPAMSEKDKKDFQWGVKNDIDYIAASFIRKVSDITEIRTYIEKLFVDAGYSKDHPRPKIISKIESTEALENFDAILKESDGIMVARGDLGVEIPMETLTNVQKEIVRKCNLAGKPVIVATQMLESMQKSPRPTRAECTDVANAVYDGADCVMLSGESAQGKFPVVSVATMKRIVDQAEVWLAKNPEMSQAIVVKPNKANGNTKDALSWAVVEASKSFNAACIIVLSERGSTAVNISKFRPSVPIVCYVKNQKAGRLLQMYRGLHPVVAATELSIFTADKFDMAVENTAAMGFCSNGDNVIFVSQEKEGDNTTAASCMRICQLKNNKLTRLL